MASACAPDGAAAVVDGKHAVKFRLVSPDERFSALQSGEIDVLSRNVAMTSSRDTELGIRFPALIDGIDNTVERLYTGWPDRLYLIGPDGLVVFKTAPGPYGFHPDGLEAALRTVKQP